MLLHGRVANFLNTPRTNRMFVMWRFEWCIILYLKTLIEEKQRPKDNNVLHIQKLIDALPNSKTVVVTGMEFSESTSAHMITLFTNLKENPR